MKLEQFERVEATRLEGNRKIPVGGRQYHDPARKHNSIPRYAAASLANLKAALRRKIVGQEEAVQAVVDLYQVFRAGLNSPGRPVGNLLFLGPTGSGKTRVVEATAEVLFGDPRAVIKVDCAEFQHSHEIAKLIGSPPGYLGHRETHPLITQEELAQYHTDKMKISVPALRRNRKGSRRAVAIAAGHSRQGHADSGRQPARRSFADDDFLTSNLGGGEITELMTGGMGFAPSTRRNTPARLDEKVERPPQEAAKRKFSPEFMNRLDKVVVFHPLRNEQLEQILEIELGMVQQRVLDTAKGRFLFRVTQPAREFLLTRRDGPEIRRAAPEARHRAPCRVPAGEPAGDRAGASGRRDLASIGTASSNILVFLKEGGGRVWCPSSRRLPNR